MNPLEIPYLLRIIFAFLGESDRGSIFRTCRIFRDNYRWVNPKGSLYRCMHYNNYKFSNEICNYVGDYIVCDLYLFYTSLSKGFEIIIHLCLDQNIDPYDRNNNAIQEASKYGILSVVDRLLMDSRVDPSSMNNYALRIASHEGHLSVVERLLMDPRVDPADELNRAIRNASLEGHLSVVDRLLMDPRVDPSAYNNDAIYMATHNGHPAVVERLLMDPRIDFSNAKRKNLLEKAIINQKKPINTKQILILDSPTYSDYSEIEYDLDESNLLPYNEGYEPSYEEPYESTIDQIVSYDSEDDSEIDD